MKNQTLLLSLFSITLIIIQNTGCASVPNLVKKYPVGSEHTGAIEFRNKSVYLPEGEWRVIGSGKAGNKSSFFEIILIKLAGNKVLNDWIFIKVETNYTDRPYGYAKDNCFDKCNYHHIVVNNNKDGGAHDAWLVQHRSTCFNTKRKAFKEAYNYIKDNDYIIPTIFIESFHRFTGKQIKRKYLIVRYYKNPEAEGFSPPISSDWATSDWHPLHINKFPKKVGYIEDIIKSNEIMHEQLKKGFGE